LRVDDNSEGLSVSGGNGGGRENRGKIFKSDQNFSRTIYMMAPHQTTTLLFSPT